MCAVEKTLNCIGFDCGNSSFRVVLGQYSGNKINMEVISQIENSTIEVNGLYYWDILKIYEGLKSGLKKAYDRCGHIDSIGICTWGVDFGLLDEGGHILANPLCYRNTMGGYELSQLSNNIKEELFFSSGIQNNRINSLYQLLGIKRNMPDTFKAAKHCLLIPDLLGYMFTGEKYTEFSIASTTQLIDVKTKYYSEDILNMFGFDNKMFKPLKEHGTVYGYLKDSIITELGINKCPVVCVPSHDTACAVTAIPTQEDDFLFISSGTWSLIGTEIDNPVVNSNVYNSDFANEGGVFGTITFLKNSAGMHIVQRIKKELESSGHSYSWNDIVNMAKGYKGRVSIFNPNDYAFFNPKNMIKAIKNKIENYDGDGSIIAAFYLSLALSYREALEQIQSITNKKYSSIHIVGGGSKNAYLNQLTADVTGLKVLSGPNEATSLGNIGVQLKYHCGLNIKEIRRVCSMSEEIQSFIPSKDRDIDDIDSRYKEYISEFIAK